MWPSKVGAAGSGAKTSHRLAVSLFECFAVRLFRTRKPTMTDAKPLSPVIGKPLPPRSPPLCLGWNMILSADFYKGAHHALLCLRVSSRSSTMPAVLGFEKHHRNVLRTPNDP
jgi:hypothetical protein